MSGAIAATAATAAATGLSASTLATGAALTSAGIGAIGSIQQSQAQAASAGYNSKISAQNAGIATQNAAFAGAQGEEDVGIQGAKNAATEGTILANQGASGVDVNSGSAVAVRQSAAKVGMLNELNIRSQAAQKAYGFQTQAVSDTAQANLDAAQSSADKTAGYIGAGTSVLGGLSQASMFSAYLADSGPAAGLTGTGSGLGAAMDEID